jgi:hypothetical protein
LSRAKEDDTKEDELDNRLADISVIALYLLRRKHPCKNIPS